MGCVRFLGKPGDSHPAQWCEPYRLYFALIENRSFLTSKNSGSQINRSIATSAG
jgi:hypothetical protein